MQPMNHPPFRLPCAACTLAVVLGTLTVAPAVACEPIRFQPGARSAEIRGTLQPEEVRCFRFGAGKRQAVELAVKSPRGNVAFTIHDLVDNREHFAFTSEKKTYEFIVYQTLRSAAADDFTLSLSIR